MKSFIRIMINITLGGINIVEIVLRPIHKKLYHYKRLKLDYEYYPDDIFIVSFPKSGTTWMQMILYQLTSNGEMDFEHINEISPYLEDADSSRKRFVDFKRRPRLIKTHLSYNDIPKTDARYIYVMRNVMDVLVSVYYHTQNLGAGNKNFDDSFLLYAAGRYGGGMWAPHLKDWLRNTSKLNVLFVKYEDLKVDLESEIRKVASFCQIKIDEETIKRVVERSGFKFMQQHEPKFNQVNGMLLDSGLKMGAFIRKGEVNEGKTHLNEKQVDILRREYDQHLSQFKDLGYYPSLSSAQ